jgi:hypothetical protein
MAPSMLSHDQSMPFSASYSSSPPSHRRRKKPSCTHSWKRSWAVEPGTNRVVSSAFHWQPVRRTKKMASAQSRSDLRGRPPPKRCVLGRLRINGSISAHSASGTRQSAMPVEVFTVSLLLTKPRRSYSQFWAFRIASNTTPLGVLRRPRGPRVE